MLGANQFVGARGQPGDGPDACDQSGLIADSTLQGAPLLEPGEGRGDEDRDRRIAPDSNP